MPFIIGNKVGEKAKGRVGIRKIMFKEVSEQLIALSPLYNELLQSQIEGVKLDEPQREGMDRFERMFEFARPKLGRIDHREELTINLNIDPTINAGLARRISEIPRRLEGLSENGLGQLRNDNGQVLESVVVPYADSGSSNESGEGGNQTPDDHDAP